MSKEHSRPVDATIITLKNIFPTDQYKSMAGVYGGEIITTIDHKMVYKTGKPLDRIDVIGDAVLRTFDDHVVKEPLKMFMKHPKSFLNIFFNSEPMRRRGSPIEIDQNIKRLGLTEYYGLHPLGIEIKKPEVFTKGIVLSDIYEVKSPFFDDIDRFQALGEATKYISQVHSQFGPVGDIVGDIIFQQKEGSKVINPVLNIPDVILTPSKKRIDFIKKSLSKPGVSLEDIDKKTNEIISKEQKAVDICELMLSSAFGEFKLSNNQKLVEKTIQTIVQNYEDKDVLKLAKSFIKRGRHTLPDSQAGGIFKSFFTLHNQAHLGANKENAPTVRQITIDQLSNHLNNF